MSVILFTSLVFRVIAGGALPQDSTRILLREAHHAEVNFERLARRDAPTHLAASSGTACDEVVGRFCLRYDDDDPEPVSEEPEKVQGARRDAISALDRAFQRVPGDMQVAGPLVRYLIEDQRADQAVTRARAYAAATRDSAMGPLLVAFALHATGSDAAAEELIEAGLRALPSKERSRVRSLDWLLSGDDRSTLTHLDSMARARAVRAVWTFADPLYLTPGNERWVEHVARYVWGRIMERTPVVIGSTTWGRDLEQLTVRYGIPVGHSRVWGTMGSDISIVDHYDPDQLAFFPRDLLSRGVPPPPLPGDTWGLENPRARSGYAPVTISKLLPLEHQLSRFPAGDSVTLRIDGVARFDSLSPGIDSVWAGLFIFDTTFARVRDLRATTVIHEDSARFRLQATLPRGRYYYSAELFEPHSRRAFRARYAAADPADSVLPPLLSDVVVAKPFRGGPPVSHDDVRLRPLPSLILTHPDTLGIYAEVTGLLGDGGGHTHYRVDLSLQQADHGSLPGEIVSWIGRRLGLASRKREPRVAWSAEGSAFRPAVVALDLGPGPLDAGLYVIRLAVTDLVASTTSERRRLIRIGSQR